MLWIEALKFFVYDTIKILILLFVMIFFIGVLRSFISPAKVKAWMQRGGIFGNFFASFLGAITPFCSCSSIPLFFGFVKAGIPAGINFSFLITSPIINEYLVVLMLGFFGWKITLAYVISGILIGVFSGFVLGKMSLEKYWVKDFVGDSINITEEKIFNNFKQRIIFGFHEAKEVVKKIWIWVIVGVGLGALIHNYVPEKTIQSILETTGVFSVPLATLIGVPMYGSCASIVPVAVALFQKGIPLGTALSFMMAISALSLPEAILLRRAMKLPLIGIFFGITTLAIIITGYLFNILEKFLM